MKKIITIIITIMLLFVTELGTGNTYHTDSALADTASGKTKTLMIYMTGADLTTPACIDIGEMSEANIGKGDNVVLMLGGAKEWPIDLPKDKNVAAVWRDNDFSLVGAMPGNSMGKPETLKEFIRYSVSSYPADEYSLILWDHGGGPIYGCCSDAAHNDDPLTIDEISSALKSAGFGSSKKLGFIGFDACLMGSLETAYALRDYASYMIFSQETEPGIGWNYAFLNSLAATNNNEALAKIIIDKYFEAGKEFRKLAPTNEFDLTLSCVDLSKVGEVETAVDNLFGVVDADVLNGLYPRIAKCRRQTKNFGKVSEEVDFGLVDLGHLSSILNEYYPKETKALNEKLSVAVVHNESEVDNTNGMSIYFPNNNSEQTQLEIKAYKTQNFAPNYTKFLDDYVAKRSGGEAEEWEEFNQNAVETESVDGKKKFSIQLTEEQIKSFEHAHFYIMRKDNKSDAEQYIPIIDGDCYEPSESGVLSEAMPDKMFFFNSYNNHMERVDSEYPVWAHLISRNENEQLYYTPAALYVVDYSSHDFGEVEYSESIHWIMKVTNGIPIMLNAFRTQDVIQNMAQKQQVDCSQFTNASFIHLISAPKRNDDGSLKPYSQWEIRTGMLTDGLMAYGFSMEQREVPDPENYVCMFEITDVNGNVYATEPVPYQI